MNQYQLFKDPRPEIGQDTRLWERLFTLIPSLDKQAANALQKRLWTLRSVGTLLRPSANGLKLTPIISPECWTSQSEFDEIANLHLKPYAREINWLLQQMMKRGDEDGG